MTTIELKQKWSELSENPATSGFRSLRISSDCICELYLGVNKEGNRCLILALPRFKQLNFKGVQKENLSIEYFRETNLIVLQLTDNDFNDLFDDLVLSLYHSIKSISHVDEYSNHFIQAFYRWSEFFEDKKSDLLPEEAIKGLIGELLVLKLLINEHGSHDINILLNSWKGPYDKGNDFELENKNLEVKTKSPSGIEVKIASEYQLEVASGKGLELVVVDVQSDFSSGLHIRDVILQIKKLIQESYGDISIFWKALNQKNISSKNFRFYDRYRFKPVNWISYNCSDVNFPKLSKSNIPEEICALKYTLKTNMLTSFILRKGDF
ncbi:MAG: PD-(D/E)XK motif protein [Bacteroidetes bacterium]|nr:PD-(D/E)XK motif protein [Bacteroidota bacterium]